MAQRGSSLTVRILLCLTDLIGSERDLINLQHIRFQVIIPPGLLSADHFSGLIIPAFEMNCAIGGMDIVRTVDDLKPCAVQMGCAEGGIESGLTVNFSDNDLSSVHGIGIPSRSLIPKLHHLAFGVDREMFLPSVFLISVCRCDRSLNDLIGTIREHLCTVGRSCRGYISLSGIVPFRHDGFHLFTRLTFLIIHNDRMSRFIVDRIGNAIQACISLGF